jgi:hypothetical protein
LISHAQKVSKISFETYWCKIFDYYGVTKARDDPVLAPLAKMEETPFDDPEFIVDYPAPRRIRI